MTRSLLLAVSLVLLLGACGDEGAVKDDIKPAPPLDEMVEPVADWSALVPAVGQTPAQSAMLTKGPLVTDLNAMLGENAIPFRRRMVGKGGVLHEEEGILVTRTGPGPDAGYLLVDLKGRAMEAGYRTKAGWEIKRTPGAALTVPKSVQALRAAS